MNTDNITPSNLPIKSATSPKSPLKTNSPVEIDKNNFNDALTESPPSSPEYPSFFKARALIEQLNRIPDDKNVAHIEETKEYEPSSEDMESLSHSKEFVDHLSYGNAITNVD